MIVLDTHALVWWLADPDTLPRKARARLDRAVTDGEPLRASGISAWEVAMLVARGRLTLTMDVKKFVQNINKGSEKLDVGSGISEVGGEKGEDGEKKVEVKESGDIALLPNPKHIYQTFNNCGPATLSMMLSWDGMDVSQKELGDKMRPYQVSNGDNDDKTIFTYEFVDWAEEYGLEALGRVNGDIELLKTFTANGIPVVVKTWLHPNEDIGHFRIGRGFDESKQVIIQDDSYEGPNKKFSYYDFLSMWQPFNYAYVIVYQIEQEDLVKTIISQDMDEIKAWEKALDRAKKESVLDSGNVYPLFNISTSEYHLGKL